MMLIRDTHFAAFNAEARLDSEKRILALLRQHFRSALAWTSDDAVAAVVRAAVDKTAEYGMHAARDAFKFAVLMMVFGPSFDREESWAQRIWAKRSGDAPIAELLCREGIEHIRELKAASP